MSKKKSSKTSPMRSAQYRDCDTCKTSAKRGRVYDSGSKLWKQCPACQGEGRVIISNI